MGVSAFFIMARDFLSPLRGSAISHLVSVGTDEVVRWSRITSSSAVGEDCVLDSYPYIRASLLSSEGGEDVGGYYADAEEDAGGGQDEYDCCRQ